MELIHFVAQYWCAVCSRLIGGYIQSTIPFVVKNAETDGERKISFGESSFISLNTYCKGCASLPPSRAVVVSSSCKVCSKDTTFSVIDSPLMRVPEGEEIRVHASQRLFHVSAMSWCSQECLDKQRGDTEIEVRDMNPLPPL